MSNFCFFTEVDLLQNQSAAHAFGPVSGFVDHKFLVTSKHLASSDPKAFAVCDGVAFIQEIAGTNKVNLILRPSQQTPFSFPKIKFFIYRNILKDSLINGNEIAPASTNDLTQSIWNSQIAYNATTGSSLNPPEEALGIDISTNDEIEKVFFRENVSYQLPVVKNGWSIGKFDKSGFGFEIVTESVGYDPLMSIVRISENILEVPPLASSPSPLQDFLHWNQKEVVLNYIDPSAFFGNFYNHKITCKKTTGNSTINGNAVYDELLKGGHLSGNDGVFFNRNKVYLDIRNEYNFSFNYLKNYGTDIQMAYDSVGALSTLNYYSDLWPICILHNFFPSNTIGNSLTLRLSLPAGGGDNSSPSLYMSCGHWRNGYPKEPIGQYKLLDLTVSANQSNEVQLAISKHTSISTTTPISCYIKLKYFKRFSSGMTPLPSNGTVIRQEHYLDNIFRPLSMRILFNGSNHLKTRFYEEEAFIDMKETDDLDYIGKIGITDDGTNLIFTIVPTIMRSAYVSDFKLPPITSEISRSFADYHGYLANKLFNKKVRKSKFDFSGTDVTYLEIINDDEGKADNIEHLQTEGIVTLGFNKQEFTLISTSGFVSGLPIFLVMRNWQKGTDNVGQEYSRAEIGLLGFVTDGLNIEVGEVLSPIKVYFYGFI